MTPKQFHSQFPHPPAISPSDQLANKSLSRLAVVRTARNTDPKRPKRPPVILIALKLVHMW